MNLHSVFISYNRGELLARALESYLETVSVPFSLVVVDNGSSDGTQAWLRKWKRSTGHNVLLLRSNKYPGFACNRGWELAPVAADFLHRADNDWEFLPGWCGHVEVAFRRQLVGQVGLRTDKEESSVNPRGQRRPIAWNVGGNTVIRRQLWDDGLRYDERPWPELPKGMSEDSYFSPAVEKMGYRWVRVRRPCIADIGLHHVQFGTKITDPYYLKSWSDRGIDPTKPPEKPERAYRKSSRRR